MRGRTNCRIRIALGVMLAIGLAACASASWAQDRGACITANVPEAFTLPDGSVHDAGRLTVCIHQALNPVVGLHRVRVDGDGDTLAMSHRSRAKEYTDIRPVLLFRHVPGTPLDLVGYVVPFNGMSWSYTLQRSDRNGFADPTTFRVARATGELVTLLASNGN